MAKEICISYGALSDPLEEQLNRQGFTLGDKAENYEELKNSAVMLHIWNMLPDSMYDKVLQRIQKELMKNIRPIDKED